MWETNYSNMGAITFFHERKKVTIGECVCSQGWIRWRLQSQTVLKIIFRNKYFILFWYELLDRVERKILSPIQSKYLPNCFRLSLEQTVFQETFYQTWHIVMQMPTERKNENKPALIISSTGTPKSIYTYLQKSSS